MNVLDTCFKILKLLEIAHEMIQSLPETDHRGLACASLEHAHTLVQNHIAPTINGVSNES